MQTEDRTDAGPSADMRTGDYRALAYALSQGCIILAAHVKDMILAIATDSDMKLW